MDACITYQQLNQARGGSAAPLVIDVRRGPAFRASSHMIAGALRRDPDTVAAWAGELPDAASIVVYCVHGHEVSQGAAGTLRGLGLNARFLEGGIEHWRAAGGALLDKSPGTASRWVTRERPKIDRIACPWLIARFIDRDAEFLYVPPHEVLRTAGEQRATPYDVPDVAFSHEGERCSFDAFIRTYALEDPALAKLATIVRGADTGRLELARESAGLLAVSLGLSQCHADDREMLAHGMVLYDALYAWCRDGGNGTHSWKPEAPRAAHPA